MIDNNFHGNSIKILEINSVQPVNDYKFYFNHLKEFGNDIGWLSNILGLVLIGTSIWVVFKFLLKCYQKSRNSKRLQAARKEISLKDSFCLYWSKEMGLRL